MSPDAQRQFLDFTDSLLASRPKMSRESVAVADAIGCPCMTDQVCDSKGGCYCKQAADRVVALVQADQSKLFWGAAE